MVKGNEDIIRLLFAMIKQSRRSDRELAKILDISQPTVTRKRMQLEKEGYIREYTLVPELAKIGYDFLAVTFMSFAEDRPELFEKAKEWTNKQPSILFAANGEGLGMDSIMVSVHTNYASYSRLVTQLRRDWQPNLKNVQSFIISLSRRELFIKDFSFRYLEAIPLEHK
ncbi:MAG TPA: Lrp/AsnC family transcriptional regulator [Candidatus Bathyarchaeia archaeon]